MFGPGFFPLVLLTGVYAATPEPPTSVGPQSLDQDTEEVPVLPDSVTYKPRPPDPELPMLTPGTEGLPDFLLKHDPDAPFHPADSFNHGMGKIEPLRYNSPPSTNTSHPEFLHEYYESFTETLFEEEGACPYYHVMKTQILTRNDQLTTSRPVRHYRTPTLVYLEIGMSAILDVRETDQIFMAHIWLYMSWHNKLVSWHPWQFCGIEHLIVPTDRLWKPDVIIEEMIERDKTPPSPFLKIKADGEVEYGNNLVVAATCRLDVYKFPFDVQRCNLTFKSLMHTDAEVRFVVNNNTTAVTKWAHMVMRTQYEWMFIKMTVTSKTNAYFLGANQTVIVYIIHMKRRSVLYAASLLLPVFFFMCMDLASFLLPDSEGETISFKLTVLLAVTLMQLLLNDILPCSSDSMPLIVVYYLGVFFLLFVSLMETILVRYLMDKDPDTQDKETNTNGTLNGHKQDLKNGSYNMATDQTLTVTTQGDISHKAEVSVEEEQTAKGPERAEGAAAPLRKEKEEEVKPDHWIRQAQQLNKGFFISYLTTVVVFLTYIAALWTNPEEDES